MSDQVVVLIASQLEEKLVTTIAGVAPDAVRVVYRPDLLPRQQYVGDNNAPKSTLTAEQDLQWRSLLSEAHVMFDFDWYDPSALPVNAPNLDWVQGTSAGIGGFLDETNLAESDITFTTASGVHAGPLSEFAVLGALYFVKDVPTLLRNQDTHVWKRYTVAELSGLSALIVGMGRIGSAIAHRFTALGVDVRGIRRSAPVDGSASEAENHPLSELPNLLPGTDILVLSCPLTSETFHLVGRDEIRMLPTSSVVINVARGDVIDQEALREALENKALLGAALDVFTEEPIPQDDPMWDLPNVLVSPHSASTVELEIDRIVDIFCENLRLYLAGVPLKNVFDPSRGY